MAKYQTSQLQAVEELLERFALPNPHTQLSLAEKYARTYTPANALPNLQDKEYNSIHCQGVGMAKTAKQELVEQIDWLTVLLQEYKKAQAHPSWGLHTQALTSVIERLEAEISLLQIKLEIMVAIAVFYPHNNLRSYPLTS